VEKPDHWQCRLLRSRHHRPRCSAAKPRDELPPSHLRPPEICWRAYRGPGSMGTALTRGGREACHPTGWCYKAPPSPKEGPGRTSREAPAARWGSSRLGWLLPRLRSNSHLRPPRQRPRGAFSGPRSSDTRPGRETASSAASRTAPAMIPAGDVGDPDRDLRPRNRVARRRLSKFRQVVLGSALACCGHARPSRALSDARELV
jgi:hypothetical protein